MAISSEILTQEQSQTAKYYLDKNRINTGIIKDTRNVTKTGEMMVFPLASTGDENDKANWIVVRIQSPFYGRTKPVNDSSNAMESTAKSYGMLFGVPDPGNLVFYFYPNIQGANVTPYVCGYPVVPEQATMIPSPKLNDKGEPVCEYNECVENGKENPPVYNPLVNAVGRQGLTDDKSRGYGESTSSRESPANARGIRTPYGIEFILDDGYEDGASTDTWETKDVKPQETVTKDFEKKRKSQVARLRMPNGAQIMIDATNDFIYFINGEGSAWLEITSLESGSLNAYLGGSVNIKANGDINLDAGGSVNINATKGFNLRTGKDANIELGSDGSILTKSKNFTNIEAGNTINIKSKGDLITSSNSFNTDAANSCFGGNVSVSGSIVGAGQISCGMISATSGTITTLGGILGTFQNATPISGMRGGMSATIQTPIQPQQVELIPLKEPQEFEDEKGNKVQSIVSALPTHEPYKPHIIKDEENGN